MNTILNPLQSDTKLGAITLAASVDLTGKENYLLKIVNDGGAPKFALPTSTDDLAEYICASGDVAGNDVAGEAPDHNGNCRLVLKGACNPGDELSLADPGTAADAGKVRQRPTTTGTWRTRFIAEEAGVDGQHILARPVSERTTVVP